MKISQLFHRYWVGIVNIGIEPDLPLLESRRIRLLNMLAAIALPFVCFYPILNWIQGRYFLAAINIVNLLSMVMVLVLHKKHWYMAARYSRIACSLFVYTISGCYFHTGAEYYLLNTLVLTIIVFDNKWVIATISSLIIAAAVFSLTFPLPVSIGPPLGVGRIWSNIALSMLFTVLALYFFKSIQQDYQQEIEKQKQALFLMNQDKEKLFSIIAHDIRSPLSGLEALIEQFQEGMLTRAELSEASVIIRNRVSALNMTLDNLLRWSALGMQGIKTQTQHFLLIPVIEEVLQFFTIVAAQKDIYIEMQVGEDIAVAADPNQVAVILRNLISNALKFSHAGGTIIISAERKESQILLRVADEGIGMDEQRAKTLFAGLQQPGFGTSGERGTGLGLLLCKEFALQNRGTLHAESQEGKGTVFTLKLQKGRVIKESAAIG